MELWIIFSVLAAFFQNVRNSLQKSINTKLSTTGAAYTRFIFGLPLAAIYWLILRYNDPQQLNLGTGFFGFAVLGGLTQVLAMWLLLRSFDHKSFAVGTAYSKTETLQTAVFTIIILGEVISGATFLAIFISLVGVCFLSLANASLNIRDFFWSWTNKGALMGLGNGALLGISAVSYRGAALSIGIDNPLLAASSTLLAALIIQTFVMATFIWLYEKGEFSKIWQNRAQGILVGFASMLGSVGWFTAMAMQNAAYVRAVGQVELIFTFLTSAIIFKEKISMYEIFGTILILVGILFLLLA